MKNSPKTIVTLAVFAFSSMAAIASDHGQSAEYDVLEMQATPSVLSSKTREEVLAELAEAQRTGDVAVNTSHGNSGQKRNKLHPENYPKKAATAGKSRSQVWDEWVVAQRSGEVSAFVPTDRQISPLHPPRRIAVEMTRGCARG